jgi:hypothetical protein
MSLPRYDEDSFTIVEYIPLGLNDKNKLLSFRKKTIYFYENGYYKIEVKCFSASSVQ